MYCTPFARLYLTIYYSKNFLPCFVSIHYKSIRNSFSSSLQGGHLSLLIPTSNPFNFHIPDRNHVIPLRYNGTRTLTSAIPPSSPRMIPRTSVRCHHIHLYLNVIAYSFNNVAYCDRIPLLPTSPNMS